jgi:hypothetical protein
MVARIHPGPIASFFMMMDDQSIRLKLKGERIKRPSL